MGITERQADIHTQYSSFRLVCQMPSDCCQLLGKKEITLPVFVKTKISGLELIFWPSHGNVPIDIRTHSSSTYCAPRSDFTAVDSQITRVLSALPGRLLVSESLTLLASSSVFLETSSVRNCDVCPCIPAPSRHILSAALLP